MLINNGSNCIHTQFMIIFQKIMIISGYSARKLPIPVRNEKNTTICKKRARNKKIIKRKEEKEQEQQQEQEEENKRQQESPSVLRLAGWWRISQNKSIELAI